MPTTVLVTGAGGLIGSEVAVDLSSEFDVVHGIDNNQRAKFFGAQGDTRWRIAELISGLKNYHHHDIDIRNRSDVLEVVEQVRPSLVVHAAAQPSHDLAAQIPFDDFDINAGGTLNLLEAVRRVAPSTVFVYLSTNKVYGDKPNTIDLVEKATRWDYADKRFADGIPETFSIDQSTHSLFGASKVAADVMVQEYGHYFGLRTCCLRGGCLTGPNHSAVQLHGFLSFLIKTNLDEKPYTILGYKGKQVRDNIHSFDVAMFIRAFYKNPRVAEVYNLGGGRDNSLSILEAFNKVSELTGKQMRYSYQDEPRVGDHICYISDLTKMRSHYPDWRITKSLDDTIGEIVFRWR